MAGNSWLRKKKKNTCSLSHTNTHKAQETHTHRMTNEREIELFIFHSTVFYRPGICEYVGILRLACLTLMAILNCSHTESFGTESYIQIQIFVIQMENKYLVNICSYQQVC